MEQLEEFKKDVMEGLSAETKRLSSKYFYDEHGDRIFQAIMHMPEYYLTNSEFEILSQHKEALLQAFDPDRKGFDLIELGAGDGLKTKVLLESLYEKEADFRYVPVDISGHALKTLEQGLRESFPNMVIKGENKDYFAALQSINDFSERPKVILFLGSNIGNFSYEDAIRFLRKLASTLRPGDKLLIGFDLKKNPKTILKAYDDPAGITRSFNLNLLKRINRELKADFALDQFDHYAIYDPESGAAKSYLVSQKEQVVHIGALEKDFHFDRGELIHTEISQKYNLSEISKMAGEAGFRITENFFDCRHFFVDSLWTI